MREANQHIRNVRQKGVVKSLVLLLFILGGLTAMSVFLDFRMDLTEEKRYSLHPATKEVLGNLKEPLEVDILLTGKLPGGMRRFQKNIEEAVETFNAYSAEPIHFRYFDPLEIDGAKEQEEYILYLSEFGINPTNLFASDGGGQTSRLIFPGVIIRNAAYETGGLLLKGEKGMSPDEMLNLSVENLEYELVNMIKKLEHGDKPAVAMITNHGELQGDEGFGIVEALGEEYEVYKVPLLQAKEVEDLLSFDAVIVAGPKDTFKEREIYLLDQYLMGGGKLLICVDPLAVSMEDAGGEGTLALGFDTGLDRLLFNYGVRINKDLIQDMNFGYYPVVAGQFGDQPQISPLPWPFFVVANRMGKHVITKGLDQLMFRFVSSLDTVKAEGVTKTPLVFSGSYSRTLPQPVRVAFQDMSTEPEISKFNQQHLPLAYLLEGRFASFYKNRFLPEEFEGDDTFKESTENGSIVVIGDSDWIQGRRNMQNGNPYPLGVDPFSETNYANREFLQNTIRYLIDPDGIMASRSKVLKIRPLDKRRVEEEKVKWQVINIVLPVVLIFLLGMAKIYLRRRKFAVKK
ncbi:gliding motility-associated ABC transporter substrate-binding protein GldG [Echinicola sediminis]